MAPVGRNCVGTGGPEPDFLVKSDVKRAGAPSVQSPQMRPADPPLEGPTPFNIS